MADLSWLQIKPLATTWRDQLNYKAKREQLRPSIKFNLRDPQQSTHSTYRAASTRGLGAHSPHQASIPPVGNVARLHHKDAILICC